MYHQIGFQITNGHLTHNVSPTIAWLYKIYGYLTCAVKIQKGTNEENIQTKKINSLENLDNRITVLPYS